MVWLVTVWKQKYHMSKPHRIPALPPILDKENEVQKQRGQPLPRDLQSQSGLVWLRGRAEPQRPSDHLSISAPRRKTMQLKVCIFSTQGLLAEYKLGSSMWQAWREVNAQAVTDKELAVLWEERSGNSKELSIP